MAFQGDNVPLILQVHFENQNSNSGDSDNSTIEEDQTETTCSAEDDHSHDTVSTDPEVCRRQAEFFNIMLTMMKREELCDVTLNVDGKVIRAHKVVLAACSSFFHAMFTTCMAEAQTSRVELKDISYDAVYSIVQFAYSGDIKLTDSNVQELLSAANQYQIQPVKDLCSQYLTSQLNTTNSLGIKNFAEFHNCTELHDAALKFIDDNFVDVCKCDEFLQLPLEPLLELLHRDQLTVRCEDEVYDSAVSWLKHDGGSRLIHKKEVLKTIRFPLITKRYLTTQVQEEPLLQDCCDCLKMIIDGMRFHLMDGQTSKAGCSEDHNLVVVPRVKKHHFKIALFGGSEHGTCQYFDPEGMSWVDLPPMTEKRRDHCVACIGCKVYILGGSFLFNLSRIDCFNLVTNKWSSVYARLENGRDQMACCVLDGIVYMTGGTQAHGSPIRSFEVFDPKLDRVYELRSMTQPRFDHGMTVWRNYIFVCGGTAIQNRSLKHCEKYNSTTGKWTDIAQMNKGRRGLGLAVVQDKVYAIGGLDDNGALLDCVECFDPMLGRWKMMKNTMPYKLRSLKCAVVGDTIWVLAGYREMGRLSTVLEYRPLEDHWTFHYNTRAFPICSVALTTVDTCVYE